MAYTRGDTVVHPQHGTAIVEGMVIRDTGRGPENFLELFIETRSLKVLVPADAVHAVGIRDLSTKKAVEEVLAILEEPSDVPEAWSERNLATMARVKSHDLDQACMVVRDLLRHQQRIGKPLSVRESTLMESCLDTVARELSLVLGMAEGDTKALIVEKSLSGETVTRT